MTQEQLITSQQAAFEMGKKGEQFVLAYERHRLPSSLHDQIMHLGQQEIARGYDILSCEDATSLLPDRYIEVKTYKGHPHFHWSDNEIAAARKYGSHYYLYLIDIDKIADFDNSSGVAEFGYEPTIIPNPAVLFEEDSQWTFQVQQYIFTLKSNEQIPEDWDDAIILLGCYNNEPHLNWILKNSFYNVREGHDSPGAIDSNDPLVSQARYLIIYNISDSSSYMAFALQGPPCKVTNQEMKLVGYPNPHAPSYLLHPIKQQIEGFHINLPPLLREVNHSATRPYGTPLYIKGKQLRDYIDREPALERRTPLQLPEMLPPEQLSEEEISKLLDKIPAVEKWIKQIKEYAVNNAKDAGIIYPNFQLKEQHTRKIEDKQAALQSIRYYDEELYQQCIRPEDLRTFSELEKIMGKQLFKQLLSPHITTRSSYRLVRDKDSEKSK